MAVYARSVNSRTVPSFSSKSEFIGSATIPLTSKSKLGMSLEPSIAGTSWNSVRWNRPLSSGHRSTSHLRNVFEPTSSSANSYSNSYAAKERSTSLATRAGTESDPGRSNSRYGTSFMSSSAPTGQIRESQSHGGQSRTISSSVFSSQPQRKEEVIHRAAPITRNWPEARTALLDLRQKLRPIPKNDDSLKAASSTLPFPSHGNLRSSPNSRVSSPPSNIPYSSSSITSPTAFHRPIPKSERPWRQRLADAARLREAQQDLMDRVEDSPTASRILAVRESRRQSVEAHQQQPELRLQKELNALKNYISDPSALDKDATVAKFRSKLAEETRFTSSSKQPAISPARFSAAGKTSQNSAESSSNKITADETKSNEELTAEQTKGPRWRRDKMTTPQQQPPPTKLSPAVSETSLSSSSTTKTYQQQQKPTTLKTAEREKPREIMTKSRLEKIPESPKNRTPSLVADQPTVTKKVVVGRTPSDDEEKKFDSVVDFKPQPATRLRSRSSQVVSAPVPGAWQNGMEERYISCNKHITRSPSLSQVEHVLRKPLATKGNTSSRVVISNGKKKASVTNSSELLSPKKEKNGDTKTSKPSESTTSAMIKIIKTMARPNKTPKICAVASVEKEFRNKRRVRLGIQKTFCIRVKPVQRISFKCRSTPSKLVAAIRLNLNILFKEQRRTANVTIISADKYRHHVESSKIKEPQSKILAKPVVRPIKPEKVEPPKVNIRRESTSDKENISARKKVALGVKNDAQPTKPMTKALKVPPAVEPIEVSFSLPAKPAIQKPTNQLDEVQEQLTLFMKRETDFDLYGAPLILPDESVLEEYVRRKRMELEKWNEDDQAGNLDDMQPSTSFPDKIGHPPTFGVSADRLKPQPPAITASLPSSNRNSLQMMGSTAIAPPPDPPSSSLTVSFNENAMETETKPTESFKRTRSDVLFMKPSVSFEPPRSLFEEKMQNQAIKLEQKAASKSSLYDPDNRLRRPSGEISAAAQALTQMANQQWQSERYAAHIPVPVTVMPGGSGRQSVSSIESANSGALDVASRQLDQMIDQARLRHNQHRSRFKEAINFLDNIFEDFQKDCGDLKKPNQNQKLLPLEKSIASNVQNQKQPKMVEPVVQVTVTTATPKNARKEASKNPPPQKTSQQFQTLATEKSPTKKQPPPPVPTKSQFTNGLRGSNNKNGRSSMQSNYDNFAGAAPPNEDVDVSETIKLPSKNTAERLDFTKKWLVGDISSWGNRPSPTKQQDAITGQHKSASFDKNTMDDHDQEDEENLSEHSLGSCSAEIAAINAYEEAKETMKKNEKQAKKKQIKQQQSMDSALMAKKPKVIEPVRPQPFRPQPQFPIAPTFFGGPLSERLNTTSTEQCPRISYSNERSTSEFRGTDSANSHEGLKPSPNVFHASTNSLQKIGVASAFVEYNPVQQNYQGKSADTSPSHMSDEHAHMAMDALVAELELNIDSSQQDLYDNRLSFPTSQREVGGGKATAGIKIVQSNSLYDKRREPQEIAGNNKLPRVSSARDRDQSTNEINKMMMKTFQTQSIETNSERERHEDRDRIAVWQKQKEAMSSASLEQLEKPHYGPVDRNPSTTARAARGAFQTINEEKLNPSRVDKYSRMFDSGRKASSISTNSAVNNVWVRKISSPPRETVSPKKSSENQMFTGFPMKHQPSTKTSVGRQQEIVRENDVLNNNEKQGDEWDENVSISSQGGLPPPAKQGSSKGRIGQLIKKLSGGGQQKPISATSMFSLNHDEEESHGGGLMKSNSFNEGIPDGEGRTEKATGISDKVNGIGSRLKQTIFGISKQ